MAEVSIRPYESDDPVVRINERALREAGGFVDPDEFPDDVELDADLRDVEGHYLDAGGCFLVAEVTAGTGDARVVGTAAFSPMNRDVVEVTRMRVLPEYQGRGIGRRLLQELETAAEERGFTEFVLDTAPQLEAAQALYESEGYETKGFVETPWSDLVIYRKRS